MIRRKGQTLDEFFVGHHPIVGRRQQTIDPLLPERSMERDVVRMVIEGGPPSNLEERTWVSPDSAILVRRLEPIRTARDMLLGHMPLIGAAASAVTLVEEWGVGDYSRAKDGRGGSRRLTATLLRRGPRPLRALDC